MSSRRAESVPWSGRAWRRAARCRRGCRRRPRARAAPAAAPPPPRCATAPRAAAPCRRSVPVQITFIYLQIDVRETTHYILTSFLPSDLLKNLKTNLQEMVGKQLSTFYSII